MNPCKNEGFPSKGGPNRDLWEARADLANALVLKKNQPIGPSCLNKKNCEDPDRFWPKALLSGKKLFLS